MSAVLLGGSGRWTDPWHPFPETNAAVTALAASAGVALEQPEDVDTALAAFATGRLPSLVVVDVGLPRDDRPVPLTEARAGFHRLLASDVPLLVLHVAATSFADDPLWERALGGVWERGTTMHPPFGPAAVRVVDDAHPITAGLPDFTLEDERYTHLRVSPSVRVLLDHEHEGERHPLAWVHERPGCGTTVYDALGHSAASFASPEHRAFLTRAVTFLAR
ncbi:ThuA domain-containing protein [Curtobacterium sp. VKM Ac-2884]|uniref:ThuA domain-containing protein n=1 Tax=Curtobacterium sp. VKM Ac-2884 TaxID=2783818 RepID=UPI00188AEC93|nr:ThuA domain-containing protein [Curtobacterium sp. VKM Ac-2884]MBF4604372.1 ThuA domain-containing protein [Curtobacterium sp. VKM Ac-2884]